MAIEHSKSAKVLESTLFMVILIFISNSYIWCVVYPLKPFGKHGIYYSLGQVKDNNKNHCIV